MFEIVKKITIKHILLLKEAIIMARFTLPRDLFYGKGSLSELKNLVGKKAIVVTGGGGVYRSYATCRLKNNLAAIPKRRALGPQGNNGLFYAHFLQCANCFFHLLFSADFEPNYL